MSVDNLASNFVITKYWNDNGIITPVNYNVVFDNVLGDSNENTEFYYNWVLTDGIRTLSKLEEIPTSYDIKAKVNSEYNQRIENSEDKTGTNIEHSFLSLNNTTTTTSSYGGAIYNSGNSPKLGNITGDFIGNYASSSSYFYYTCNGAAIFNNCGEITIRENSSFTGNWITTYNSTTKNFEAIYNGSTSTTATNSIINFNAYDSSKSIVVNDGINGYQNNKSYQILNINNAPEEGSVSYGTVEFNSFVKNQTVNVENGKLRLGSFAVATLDVNGTELVVSATHASLTNTDINVKNGAILEFGVSLDATGNINSALVTLDTSSAFTFEDGAKIQIDLGDFSGEFEFVLLEYTETFDMTDILATLNDSEITSVLANGIEQIGWSVSQGEGDSLNKIFVSDSTVPEPSTYAIIIGALALGFVAYRRRK